MPSRNYYIDTWGFDPEALLQDLGGGRWCLEDGFPLAAPGDENLFEAGATLWARVEWAGGSWGAPDPVGVHNSLVLKWGNQEGTIDCVHTAIYAAPLGERATFGEETLADLVYSTEDQPVYLPPVEHFASLRSLAAGCPIWGYSLLLPRSTLLDLMIGSSTSCGVP